MPRKKQLTPAAAFQAVVRTALEHLHEPAWLAAHSPLAEAYFLADRLAADTPSAEARGMAPVSYTHLDVYKRQVGRIAPPIN